MNRMGIETNRTKEGTHTKKIIEQHNKRGIIHKQNANGQTESTNEMNKLNGKMSY